VGRVAPNALKALPAFGPKLGPTLGALGATRPTCYLTLSCAWQPQPPAQPVFFLVAAFQTKIPAVAATTARERIDWNVALIGKTLE